MAQTSRVSLPAKRRWPWQRLPEAGASMAAAPVISLDGTTILIGGFPVVRTFARGAMGELHLATDPATRLPIALKTVRFHAGDLSRERFLRESAAAARLQHPHIVSTYAAGIDGTGASLCGWIAMEWVSGSDLSRYASPPRLLPEPLLLEIGASIAEGLFHAHGQGVIHRDIKPSNILLNLAAGTVKITDFGCAHLSDGERSRSGLLIGTPVYMAPEQLAGQAVDGRTDLYALGVLLFQLLTGRLPFDYPSMGPMLAAIANEPPPDLLVLRPDLPRPLDELLQALMAKNPDQRPADGQQVAALLRQLATNFYASSPRSATGQADNT